MDKDTIAKCIAKLEEAILKKQRKLEMWREMEKQQRAEASDKPVTSEVTTSTLVTSHNSGTSSNSSNDATVSPTDVIAGSVTNKLSKDILSEWRTESSNTFQNLVSEPIVPKTEVKGVMAQPGKRSRSLKSKLTTIDVNLGHCSVLEMAPRSSDPLRGVTMPDIVIKKSVRTKSEAVLRRSSRIKSSSNSICESEDCCESAGQPAERDANGGSVSTARRLQLFPAPPKHRFAGDGITDFQLPEEIFQFAVKKSPPDSSTNRPTVATTYCQSEDMFAAVPDHERNIKLSPVSRVDDYSQSRFSGGGDCLSHHRSFESSVIPSPEVESTLCFGCPLDGAAIAVHCRQIDGATVVVLGQKRKISVWKSIPGENCRLLTQFAITLKDSASWRFDGYSTSSKVGMLVAQDFDGHQVISFYGISLTTGTPLTSSNKELSLCNEHYQILFHGTEDEHIVYASVNKDVSCLRKYHMCEDSIISVLVLDQVEDYLNSLLTVEHFRNAIMGVGVRKIYIWNICSGVLVRTIRTCDPIESCWLSRSEEGIIFLGVNLLTNINGNSLQLLAHNPATSTWKNTSVKYKDPENHDPIGFTSIMKTGSYLVGMAGTGPIYIWNFYTGDLMFFIKCRATCITALRLSKTASMLTVGEQNGEAKTYKLPF